LLIIHKHEEKDDVVVYRFYPEGELEGDYGLISINKISGEVDMVFAPNKYFDHFGRRGFPRLREYQRNQEYKQKDLIAWG
jgi:hypothetical protein